MTLPSLPFLRVSLLAGSALLSACNLQVSVSGEGSVTSDTQEINCTSDNQHCSLAFNRAQGAITLQPVPATGWAFSHWTGACESVSDACPLLLSGTRRLQTIAVFTPVTVQQDCGDVPHGTTEQRLRFQSPIEAAQVDCRSETQQRTCTNGAFTHWSGDYQFTTCVSQSDQELPLLNMSDLHYQGGFRLSAERYGDSEYASLNYSSGAIAYHPQHHSLFVVSHEYQQAIAEFAIPTIINSRNPADFAVGDVLQPFSAFHNTGRVNTGIDNHFRITGMALIDGKLVVNYFNWYDASGQETDTSVVFSNADALAVSPIRGPYQLQGAAHAAGWLTPIPAYWQASLGGTYISGFSSGSIISRLSVGPSGFVLTPADNLLSSHSPGPIPTTTVLDFPLDHPLYDKALYGPSPVDVSSILRNDDRHNPLWTFVSGALFGVIVPGTDTYITVGYSGGHQGGVGYKITQDNGNLCGGYCSYLANDNGNMVWLWRVSDLVKVRQGELQPHDVRPYQYGTLDTPGQAPVASGAYDAENNRLILSLLQGDRSSTYVRAPLFVVYDIAVDE